MRNERDWKRLGSEAEAEDRRAGNSAPSTDEELCGILADYFEADLHNAEICDDETAAVDALVAGYRTGAS